MTSTPPTPPSAADLHAQLEQSDSTHIYVDLGELADEAVEEFLVAEGLKLERDVVRDLWSVRKASEDEVAEATAEAEAVTTTTTTSTPSSSSTTPSSSSSSSTSSTPHA